MSYLDKQKIMDDYFYSEDFVHDSHELLKDWMFNFESDKKPYACPIDLQDVFNDILESYSMHAIIEEPNRIIGKVFCEMLEHYEDKIDAVLMERFEEEWYQ